MKLRQMLGLTAISLIGPFLTTYARAQTMPTQTVSNNGTATTSAPHRRKQTKPFALSVFTFQTINLRIFVDASA